ncbi:hypothetical protein V6V47_16330 [Micromonospora sp. CPCC 205539]|uniref:hypothetical protein n=1 Tax=Micromonospora sp. CPCC 205539 TaxID=3122408 RepID=UPI002FF0438D
MSELEWMPVVESAALALGAAAGTGIWMDARNGILALARRAGRDEAGTAELLDETDARVRTADAAAEQDRVRERAARDWQVRLDDLFRRTDGASEDLFAWTAEVTGRLPADQRRWVQHITASAQGATAQGVMFGDIVNHPGPAAP